MTTSGGEVQEQVDPVQAKADALRGLVSVNLAIATVRAQLAQMVDQQRPAAVQRAIDAGWSLHGLAEAQQRALVDQGHAAASVSVETLKADLRVARRS